MINSITSQIPTILKMPSMEQVKNIAITGAALTALASIATVAAEGDPDRFVECINHCDGSKDNALAQLICQAMCWVFCG